MNQTPIFFENSFSNLNSYLKNKEYSQIFILVDSHTHEFCLPLVLENLETLSPIEILEIPPNEDNKDIEILIGLWESLTELGGSRKSLLINLGGGVITDMGGFLASTFKRGIDFINIPTTLLSMVDASVGGKTGINFAGLKNQIGNFSLPVITLINSNFLQTLPEREFRSGLAEMLKHGLIYNKQHWENLKHLNLQETSNIVQLIEDSVRIKSEIVELDPKESGLRKILNFGHTIGHAVESYFLKTENPLLHGEAIAVGMLIESIISFENELISKQELDEIFHFLPNFFSVEPIDENTIPELLELMKHDKKNFDNKISFSLLDGIGKSKFDVFLNENQIKDGILKFNSKMSKK